MLLNGNPWEARKLKSNDMLCPMTGWLPTKSASWLEMVLKKWGSFDLFGGNAGQALDKLGDGAPWVNEGLERVENLVTLELYCPYFNNNVTRRLQPGRLQVKSYVDLVERSKRRRSRYHHTIPPPSSP